MSVGRFKMPEPEIRGTGELHLPGTPGWHRIREERAARQKAREEAEKAKQLAKEAE